MRVAGLRLLAALAAAGGAKLLRLFSFFFSLRVSKRGWRKKRNSLFVLLSLSLSPLFLTVLPPTGGVAAPRLLLLSSESRRSGGASSVASPPRPSSPLAAAQVTSSSLSASVVLDALVSSLASGPDDEAAAAAEAAGNLAIMLGAAAPSPSCSGVVGGGGRRGSESNGHETISDATFPNSMPPSRAAAAALALSRMRSCSQLVALLRALAVPNGSRGGGGTMVAVSKNSKKKKNAKVPALQTRGTADAPGRPPAPVPTSPRAMALRALAALGEVAAVDEAL